MRVLNMVINMKILIMKKNKNYKGWWLNFLEIDWDWDVKFMKPIMAINYCPFCGVKLNVE